MTTDPGTTRRPDLRLCRRKSLAGLPLGRRGAVVRHRSPALGHDRRACQPDDTEAGRGNANDGERNPQAFR